MATENKMPRRRIIGALAHSVGNSRTIEGVCKGWWLIPGSEIAQFGGEIRLMQAVFISQAVQKQSAFIATLRGPLFQRFTRFDDNDQGLPYADKQGAEQHAHCHRGSGAEHSFHGRKGGFDWCE